ncbi:hypothetical protein HYALB_00012836 [Hymenoscyphus albidus]|uniref:O-methyltransferase C-terminal domain-containing protein n=1 Tax=Hymenoscyphus albidus TaxID=595503 RepID=A0A9N9LNK1_9HELO|nr:hypothetical protein HYALB_00012836 [Hymenoscyphus albidus]
MPDHHQIIEVARAISIAAEKLNDFYDEEALELSFPGGKPTSEQGEMISSVGGLFDLASLHIIHDSGIAKHVPSEGTITIAELVNTCGIPHIHLRRILRHAITNRIFTEPIPESISHTPISTRLAHDPVMRATVGMLVDEMFPAAPCFSRAMRRYGTSTGPTDTAWALANDAHRPMVEELEAEHPVRAAQFAAFMRWNWSVQQPLQPLIENFDWAALGKGRVVDDFEEVVKNGERMFLEEIEDQPELRDRVQFMAHDAFEEQPVKGAGVYLLRSVLHDWPDESCVDILRSLVPALKKGAMVLVNDFVMPGMGEMDFLAERRARSLDLLMTALFNAREREAGEWEPLFAKADGRFRFEGVRKCVVNETGIPTEILLSVIVATWMG